MNFCLNLSTTASLLRAQRVLGALRFSAGSCVPRVLRTRPIRTYCVALVVKQLRQTLNAQILMLRIKHKVSQSILHLYLHKDNRRRCVGLPPTGIATVIHGTLRLRKVALPQCDGDAIAVSKYTLHYK